MPAGLAEQLREPAASACLLLVEPTDGRLGEVRSYLEDKGFAVARAAGVAAAVRRVSIENASVAILDGALGAVEVLRACEAFAGRTAVIVLTGGEPVELGLAALDAGADDFLPSPHNPRELLARVRALIRSRRRRAGSASRSLGAGLTLDHAGRVVASDGRSVLLTPVQHRLLELLARRPGEVLPRGDLLELVYGDAGGCWDRAIDVNICRLRKRLASLGAMELIIAYRGVGYRLAPPALPR